MGARLLWSERHLYAGTPLLALIGIYWDVRADDQPEHRPPPPAADLSRRSASWLAAPRSGSGRCSTGRAPGAADRTRTGASRDAGGPVAQPGRSDGRPRWRGDCDSGALAWHVGESVTIRPDYLAYFNQLAGGPSEGYKHLADSSLDWGQDLPGTEAVARRRGPAAAGRRHRLPLVLRHGSPGVLRDQGHAARGFIDRRPPQPPEPLGGGVYCISATVLDVVGPSFYRPADETNYQAALQNLVAFARASENEQTWSALLRQTGEQYWHDLFRQFDQLRTGRLVAFLRNRQPDAMVGYSILIYRLTDREVALGGQRSGTGRPPVTVHSQTSEAALAAPRREAGARSRRNLAAADERRRSPGRLRSDSRPSSCYVNAVGNEFVLDDTRIIRDNLRIGRSPTFPHLFASSYWDLAGPQALYRPLVLVTYASTTRCTACRRTATRRSTSPCTRRCRCCCSRWCGHRRVAVRRRRGGDRLRGSPGAHRSRRRDLRTAGTAGGVLLPARDALAPAGGRRRSERSSIGSARSHALPARCCRRRAR